MALTFELIEGVPETKWWFPQIAESRGVRTDQRLLAR
jgi:hypothetical protein